MLVKICLYTINIICLSANEHCNSMTASHFIQNERQYTIHNIYLAIFYTFYEKNFF